MMRATLVYLAFGLTSASAGAKVIRHQGAKVQIWMPDNWSKSVSGETISIADPQREVSLEFQVSDGGSIDDTVAGLGTLMALMFTNLQPTGPATQENINGMQSILRDFTGVYQGQPVNISVMVCQTPSGKVMLVFGVIESNKLLKHLGNVLKVMKGLQPLKPASSGWR